MEAKLFDQVNDDYKAITEVFADSNAVRATSKEGTLDRLTIMEEKLNKIQKALDQYLELKRQYFPASISFQTTICWKFWVTKDRAGPETH